MAKIDRMLVGESLVGEGNEVAHIDLIIGPRGSPVETAFAHALTNNKDGFTSLLAVVAPNLLTKPATILFNKVTIKGAKQAVQMFGPAQRAVAMAVADSVEDGTIPADEADNLFICVGVFIHWLAEDDKKIQDYNYQAVKESIARAVKGEPNAREVVEKKGTVTAPVRRRLRISRRSCVGHGVASVAPGPVGAWMPAVGIPGTMPAPIRDSIAAPRSRNGTAGGKSCARRSISTPTASTSSNLCGLVTRTRTQNAPNSSTRILAIVSASASSRLTWCSSSRRCSRARTSA